MTQMAPGGLAVEKSSAGSTSHSAGKSMSGDRGSVRLSLLEKVTS